MANTIKKEALGVTELPDKILEEKEFISQAFRNTSDPDVMDELVIRINWIANEIRQLKYVIKDA